MKELTCVYLYKYILVCSLPYFRPCLHAFLSFFLSVFIRVSVCFHPVLAPWFFITFDRLPFAGSGYLISRACWFVRTSQNNRGRVDSWHYPHVQVATEITWTYDYTVFSLLVCLLVPCRRVTKWPWLLFCDLSKACELGKLLL